MNLDDERYCKCLHLSPVLPEDYNRKTENCTYKICFFNLRTINLQSTIPPS